MIRSLGYWWVTNMHVRHTGLRQMKDRLDLWGPGSLEAIWHRQWLRHAGPACIEGGPAVNKDFS